MTFQITEPILIIGIGGVGSKLAVKAKESLDADCFLISHDQKDLSFDCPSIKVNTKSVVNPSIQLIRGSVLQNTSEIISQISKYSTVVLVTNLAGKGGASISPVISKICRENNKNMISFAIMPFKFEKDRLFSSGISLKRLRNDSGCTVVLDNDALLDSNPDLTPKACHEISNEAILKVMSSLQSTEISEHTNIISTSREEDNVEDSLKDSIRMLYEDAPPNSVKRSILYVLGGHNIPVGVLNSVTNIAGSIFNDENTSISTTVNSSEKSKIIMLTSVQGETHFDKYDPLSIIPEENTLDWDEPDCSINCNLNLYQLE
jgi:cell division protein FtsZ